MRATRRHVVRMLAAAVPLAGASDGIMRAAEAAAAAAQTPAPATPAPYVPERLRDLRLDDGIEPAVRFRPRI